MKPFLNNGAKIQLKPDGGWNWDGWDGVMEVEALPNLVKISNQDIIRENDMPGFMLSFAKSGPKMYKATGFSDTPGTIITSNFTVDNNTPDDKLKVSGGYGLVITSTGKFTCNYAVPSTKVTPGGPVPDPVPVKTGTWEVVNANQKIAFRNSSPVLLNSVEVTPESILGLQNTHVDLKLFRINSSFPGRQKYYNCGIQSLNQLIELTTCKKTEEEKLLIKAVENNNARVRDVKDINKDSSQEERKEVVQILSKGTEEEKKAINKKWAVGGTTSAQRDKILDENGVPLVKDPNTRRSPKYSRAALSQALKENKATIQSVDAYKMPGWEKSRQVGKHAVGIAAGKFDNNGNLTHVYISDTGIGKQTWMSIDEFDDAQLKGETMDVSKDPVKEKCP